MKTPRRLVRRCIDGIGIAFIAVLLTAGYAMTTTPVGACNVKCQWMFIAGDWTLHCMCSGYCPSEEYTCQTVYDHSPPNGFLFTCSCNDADGNPHGSQPECPGQGYFDNDDGWSPVDGYCVAVTCEIDGECTPAATYPDFPDPYAPACYCEH